MRRIKLILAATAAMAMMLTASAAPATAQVFSDGSDCEFVGFIDDEPVFLCDFDDGFFDETPGVSQSFSERGIESGAATPSFTAST